VVLADKPALCGGSGGMDKLGGVPVIEMQVRGLGESIVAGIMARQEDVEKIIDEQIDVIISSGRLNKQIALAIDEGVHTMIERSVKNAMHEISGDVKSAVIKMLAEKKADGS
jgi:hypothetical protein